MYLAGGGLIPCIRFLFCFLYSHVTNYHKLSCLKHYPFISSQFLWIRNPSIEWLSRIHCLEVHKAEMKVSHSFLETLEENLLQAPSGCWQNLIPPHIFHAAPSTFKTARAHRVFFMLWISKIFPSPFSSATNQIKFSAFKDSLITLVPPSPIISFFQDQLCYIT